jgi:cellobiose phosphorylase
VHYRFRETVYHIAVSQSATAGREPAVWVDGALQADHAIPLVDDRAEHSVEVIVRSAPA